VTTAEAMSSALTRLLEVHQAETGLDQVGVSGITTPGRTATAAVYSGKFWDDAPSPSLTRTGSTGLVGGITGGGGSGGGGGPATPLRERQDGSSADTDATPPAVGENSDDALNISGVSTIPASPLGSPQQTDPESKPPRLGMLQPRAMRLPLSPLGGGGDEVESPRRNVSAPARDRSISGSGSDGDATSVASASTVAESPKHDEHLAFLQVRARCLFSTNSRFGCCNIFV
jgi:hypothetical protein